ncbi:hypothetical protein RclHR1_03320009 [Rhizophagus clarus]|uniref:F-box domain-containing protein n=1 Tax=Rhizophagus clarus TaxID=94130 RepID=A0A2Z6R9H6_9GLOM|nr:hypothetical protein RclHR1_03320009 [Rhizophagus clarus]GET00423.1 hypothetical protein GLOIN_2v1784405 [Rhizophagus clarus]
MTKLFADCLKEIFEYLENDKVSLYSCLLVNRLWCEVSVRILWRDVFGENIQKYNSSCYDTLISCLPNESKEILSKNGIIISTPNTKLPMFNYAGFCKVISTFVVYYRVEKFLKNRSSKDLNLCNKNNVHILTQEIFKLYMKQIPSLEDLRVSRYRNLSMVPFLSCSEAKDCLKNLSILYCVSNIYSGFFYHLSQICHNIHSLIMDFDSYMTSGLMDLISAQKNLKYLKINHISVLKDIIIPNNNNTITKLEYYNLVNVDTSLSFISKFTNLEELSLKFKYMFTLDFRPLQYINFPQLRIFKIQNINSNYEVLINFLEINGNNLKEFHLNNSDSNGDNDDSLNLAIAKYCLNLRNLTTGFKSNELKTLKFILNSCQYLESIKTWCIDDRNLVEKVLLYTIAKFSHENLYKIIILTHKFSPKSLLPSQLESFFKKWKNRTSQNSLYLVMPNIKNDNRENIRKNKKIIEKYTNLGVIKKFKLNEGNIIPDVIFYDRDISDLSD